MGRESKRITVTASVSRHNSEQDRLDDEALETLRTQIDHLVACLPEGVLGYVDVSGP